MDSLSLLEHSRALTGQLKVTLNHQDKLFMPLAGVQLSALLPGFQNSMDQIAGVASGVARTEDMLA
jgi:hypothetical protein